MDAKNCTGEMCARCYEVGLYHPGQVPVSPSLLLAALVHIGLVVILGTLFNGLAIWCVATCKRSRTAVKVLLCGVFVPLLLICLVTRAMRLEAILAILQCDPTRASATKTFGLTTALLYNFLAQMEQACIAALAIVRAVAVWSPQRHTLSLCVALTVVVSLLIYSFFSVVGIFGAGWLGYIQGHHLQEIVTIIYFFTAVMLPFLVTAIAYALMMFAVRRNRERLAVSQARVSPAATTDQATRAMMAVLVSNLVFGFPHAVYHLLVDDSNTLEIIFHMLFYTHFVVDPLAFIWFNSHYRHTVRQLVAAAWRASLGGCSSSLHKHSFRKVSSTLQFWTTYSIDQKSYSTKDLKEVRLTGMVLTKV